MGLSVSLVVPVITDTRVQLSYSCQDTNLAPWECKTLHPGMANHGNLGLENLLPWDWTTLQTKNEPGTLGIKI